MNPDEAIYRRVCERVVLSVQARSALLGAPLRLVRLPPSTFVCADLADRAATFGQDAATVAFIRLVCEDVTSEGEGDLFRPTVMQFYATIEALGVAVQWVGTLGSGFRVVGSSPGDAS